MKRLKELSRGKPLLVGYLTVILVLILSMSNPTSAQQQPKLGGTLVVGLGGNPPHFNLGPSISFLVYQTASNIYSFLIRYDKEMKWQPDLAESWQRSSDGLTYTFRLRKDALWHDGKPVTSEDVKFTFEQIHARYGGNTGTWQAATVQTPDENTVVFKFPKYDSLFEAIVGNIFSPIYPKHLWKDSVVSADAMLRSPYARAPVGSGPFKFKAYVPGSHIELTKNERYFKRDMPYVDRLLFRILPDPQSRLVALETGEIDLMPRDINLNEIARLKTLPNLRIDVDDTVSGKHYVIFVNVRKGPLAKRTVRQAISHALDRNRIAKLTLFGFGSPSWNPLLNTKAPHARSVVNANIPTYPHSYEKARELLDQAGYPLGVDGKRFRVRLLVETTLTANVPMAELVKNDLKQVGIEADIQKVDTPTAQDLVYLRWDFDLYLLRITTFNAPVLQLNQRVTTRYIRKGFALNAVGYSNPEVDALYARAMNEPDPKRRTDLLFKIQELVATHLPMIPIVEEPDVRGYTVDLQGMPQAAQGDEAYDTVWRISTR